MRALNDRTGVIERRLSLRPRPKTICKPQSGGIYSACAGEVLRRHYTSNCTHVSALNRGFRKKRKRGRGIRTIRGLGQTSQFDILTCPTVKCQPETSSARRAPL